jgi:Domain of unknown function (DUF4160)
MSPTIFIENSYRVMIFPNDHPPAHVHVLKGEKRASFYLTPVSLRENDGFSPAEIRDIVELIRHHKGHCWRMWHDLHGK